MARKKNLEIKSTVDRPSAAHSSFFANSSEEAQTTESASRILLTNIELAAEQPRDRSRITDTEIDELLASIRKHGILQPIVVRPIAGGKYELIAGERRYRACLKAGFEEIPAVVTEVSDEEAYEIALVENLQRKDLNAIEKTAGILKLCARQRGCTEDDMRRDFIKFKNASERHPDVDLSTPEWQSIDDIFEYLGKKRESFVIHDLPMLKWQPDIQDAIKDGLIKPGHGTALNRVGGKKARLELLQQTIDEGLSVREVTKRVRALEEGKSSQKKAKDTQAQSSTAHPLVQRMGHFCKAYKPLKKWNVPEDKTTEVARLQEEIEERLQRLETLLK